MEPIVLMNVKWGEGFLVPMYLFFGGVTGGAYIVAVLADLFSIKHRHLDFLAKVAAYTAIPIFILAGLAITFHLGKPERGILFPFYFTNYNSWMVLGGWSIAFSAPFVVLTAAMHYFSLNANVRRVIGVIGIPVLIWLVINTAMLLSGAGFVPLWSRTWLPLLFVNSGMLTGVAGVGLIFLLARQFLATAGEQPVRVLHTLSYGAVLFEVLEIIILYAFLNFLATTPQRPTPLGEFLIPGGSNMAYEYVVKGELALWFWVGVIAVGLAIPLAISLFNIVVRRWEIGLALVKFSLILVGGALLRFVIVWGGDLSAPLPFPPSNIPPMMGG